MQKVYDEFTQRDTVVIAVAQEDTGMKSHRKMYDSFESPPPFHIVGDFNHKKTKLYKRTTAYLIDKEGIVRQIFPMKIHQRPSWKAILREVDALNEAS